MWDWAIWAALAVAVASGGGALAFLAVRALQAWRTFKGTRRRALRSLDDLVAKGQATADKAAGAGDTEELQASVARLRVSLARLAVLRAALDEAGDSLGRVTAVVPRA